MNRLSLLPAFLLLASAALAQSARTVTATYLYQIPDNVAPDKAKEIALDRAKIQAIADEFGTTVSQTNTTSIEMENGNATSRFLSTGGSELKGEWLETIGAPQYEFISDGSALALKVTVKGKIREIAGEKIPISLRIFRNAVEPANETTSFQTGDALFMTFNASAKGYLAVYIIDEEDNAFCLLPYSGQSDGCYHTKANHTHYLFSRGHADDIDKEIVDELILETSGKEEHNRIVAIFSPNKFYKAVDSKVSEDLPRNLPYDDFTKWLGNVRKRDVELSVVENFITISNSK